MSIKQNPLASHHRMGTNKSKKKSSGTVDAEYIGTETCVLGKEWTPIYRVPVDFSVDHFTNAMSNLIKQPNINSTVIMRADILQENIYDSKVGNSTFTSADRLKFPEFPSSGNHDDVVLHRDLQDIKLRTVDLSSSKIELSARSEVIRRIIPRNPFKDHIINQTCLIYQNDDNDALVVYIPHIDSAEETPFYLPPVYAIGLLYHESTLSIHYFPFHDTKPLNTMDQSERPIRIALRLIQTSSKHSNGAKTGYEKRVNHDVVVPKIAFQNRYISLKKKYSSKLVNLWAESTDPKKHVFEDLAIAAFLIEFWQLRFKDKPFEFRDLGCGNGLLVYILIMEGYNGKGIDARRRKSWATYPQEVQDNLKEQIIVPQILLKPHPAVSKLAPHVGDNGRLFNVPQLNDNNQTPNTFYSSANLLSSPKVCTGEDFPENTFIIGNHSDELTCWIPLFQLPFIVIPCCSHALSGAKFRYSPRKHIKAPPTQPGQTSQANGSTYASLVDHVEDISNQMGWVVEKEMLRIPSTRNAAIIGADFKQNYKALPEDAKKLRPWDVLAMEGGAEGWVENSVALMKKAPRSH
jgi:tRNASer (uridine44-2'-O)-methyltransferase